MTEILEEIVENIMIKNPEISIREIENEYPYLIDEFQKYMNLGKTSDDIIFGTEK